MSSILQHQGQWRAHICVQGKRQSRIFRTKAEARAWCKQSERELKPWDASDITLLSLSDLIKLPPVTSALAVSGVYFLWDADWNLAYIGQSRNIAKRVQRHKVEPPAAFQYATALRVPIPWQLAVEALYIAEYGQEGRNADISNRIESYVPRP